MCDIFVNVVYKDAQPPSEWLQYGTVYGGGHVFLDGFSTTISNEA